MIHAIITTYSTPTDRNGNRYHAGTITSTATGKSMDFRHVGGDRNLPIMLRDLMGFDWSEVSERQATVGKRQLPDKGHFEHDGMPLIWSLFPADVAVNRLGQWLAEIAQTMGRAVEVENDGNAPETYRRQWGIIESTAWNKLESACKAWKVKLDRPGVYPCLNIGGRDETLTIETATPIAKRIIAMLGEA